MEVGRGKSWVRLLRLERRGEEGEKYLEVDSG